MATHIAHPDPEDRPEFLVDGCPRCEEYVRDLGVNFEPERFRNFWYHMTEVEWESRDHYRSALDAKLGGRLYLVSIAFEKAFGLHPTMVGPTLAHQLREGLAPFIEVTDPRD